MTDLAALARAFDTAYVTALLEAQVGRLAPLRISEMEITAVARFTSTALPTGMVAGMGGMATGTGPGGEIVTAMFGDYVPTTGQRWRVAWNGVGGDGWLEDLARSVAVG